MVILNKSTRKQKAIKMLKVLNKPQWVDNMLNTFGSTALYHRSIKDSRAYLGRDFTFKATQNLVMNYYQMKSKSISLQRKINHFISARYSIIVQDETTLDNSQHISFYNGFFSGKDSSPKLTKVKRKNLYELHSLWIDKYNHKPTYDLLNNVKRDLHKQLNKYKDVDVDVGRIENPHHKSKQNHIYSHGHYHYLIMLANDSDCPEMIHKIKSLIRKDFSKEFNYTPVHNSIKPLFYYDFGDNGLYNLNPTQPSIFGKHNSAQHKIPVKLTTKPTTCVVNNIKHFTHNNVAYQAHKNEIKQVDDSHIAVNSNLLTYMAVDFYVEYISKDYRLQTKDSDDFLDDKDLTRQQKALTFSADINSGGNKSIINSVSKNKVRKTVCIGLNKAIQAQQKQLEFHLQVNHLIKIIIPEATFQSDLKQLKIRFKQRLFKLNQHKLECSSYQNQILNLVVYRTLLAELTTNRTYINGFGIDKNKFNFSSLLLLSNVETLDLFRQKPT